MILFRARWGRTWTARLDVDAAVRVLALADVDVMAAAVDPATRDRLAAPSAESSADLAAAVYAIFQPQADRLGVSPRRFGRQLRAVTDAELRELFFDEVAAFFWMPGPEPKAENGDEPDPSPAELWQLLYRSAGELGVPVGQHTFGEIAVMADGRRRVEWPRNALLRADVQNTAPGRDPVDPVELDPSGALAEAREKNPRKGIAITPDNLVTVFGAVLKLKRTSRG